MNFEIPKPLRDEHEALHEQLRQATQAEGEEEVMYPAAVLVGQVVKQRLGGNRLEASQ